MDGGQACAPGGEAGRDASGEFGAKAKGVLIELACPVAQRKRAYVTCTDGKRIPSRVQLSSLRQRKGRFFGLQGRDRRPQDP
mmetsp:Transcript_13629/g.26584  ORF Transcript_13629/g.26584 Transcript_13629/m.26584 type:complete len:82 (-) Transcript_13629:52-297(-)